MATSQENPSVILAEDDEDLALARMDRKCYLRTSMVPKKAYTSVREPSIVKQFSEIREANFLDDGGKEEARVPWNWKNTRSPKVPMSKVCQGTSNHLTMKPP